MLKKPSWITTFSLLGMLRIPKTFEIAPFPICFYEGDDMGEKIVKEVRPILLTGLRKGWTLAVQGTHYRMKTLSYMQDLLLSRDSLDVLAVKTTPVRCKAKIYKYSSIVEYAIEMGHPFAFAVFKETLTNDKVIGYITSYQKELFIHILNIADEPTFQDPCGFAYFTTSTHPKKEHRIIDHQCLNTIALTFLATGVALPSVKTQTYAFILSTGEKKVPGEKNSFSPAA